MKYENLGKGRLVRSKAGHDKGDFQIVIGCDENNLLVCDGKNRKINKPKKKNIKHLEITNTILNENVFSSDSSVRKALQKYTCSKSGDLK